MRKRKLLLSAVCMLLAVGLLAGCASLHTDFKDRTEIFTPSKGKIRLKELIDCAKIMMGVLLPSYFRT